MTVSITPRQRDLLVFIGSFQASQGYCPSYAEMASGLGGVANSSIHRLLSGLEERGAIRRLHNRARGIEVLKRPQAVSRAPDGAPLYFVAPPEARP